MCRHSPSCLVLLKLPCNKCSWNILLLSRRHSQDQRGCLLAAGSSDPCLISLGSGLAVPWWISQDNIFFLGEQWHFKATSEEETKSTRCLTDTSLSSWMSALSGTWKSHAIWGVDRQLVKLAHKSSVLMSSVVFSTVNKLAYKRYIKIQSSLFFSSCNQQTSA